MASNYQNDWSVSLPCSFNTNITTCLTSLDEMVNTLSVANSNELDDNLKSALQDFSSKTEMGLRNAESCLNDSIQQNENELTKLLRKENVIKDSIQDIQSQIRSKESDVRHYERQIKENRREQRETEESLRDTQNRIDDAQGDINTNKIVSSVGTAALLGLVTGGIGFIVAGAGVTAIAITQANISELEDKRSSLRDLSNQQKDEISSQQSEINSASRNISQNNNRVRDYQRENTDLGYTLNKLKREQVSLANIQKEVKTVQNSVSRLHSFSNIVLIESKELYELNIFTNSLINLCRAVENKFPEVNLVKMLEDVNGRLNNALESQFSF